MTGSADTPETQAQGALFAHDRLQSIPEPFCVVCRTPLTGKQTKFCGQDCNNTLYAAKHPRLGLPIPKPGDPRQPIRIRILGVLMDRAWHTLRDLSLSLGVAEATVSAKLRDLRKPDLGNCVIEHRTANVAYSRHAQEYRLVVP